MRIGIIRAVKGVIIGQLLISIVGFGALFELYSANFLMSHFWAVLIVLFGLAFTISEFLAYSGRGAWGITPRSGDGVHSVRIAQGPDSKALLLQPDARVRHEHDEGVGGKCMSPSGSTRGSRSRRKTLASHLAI